ncbi:hypothetical protein BH10PSE4_BH10PSE4_04950 [soil metagenome]
MSRASRILTAVLMSGLLAGCSATSREPPIKIQIVKVPVPVACAPDLGPEPSYPDTPEALQAAPNIFERVKLLLAGRIERQQRLAVLGAALKACASLGRMPEPALIVDPAPGAPR